jgi:hypothetical protein
MLSWVVLAVRFKEKKKVVVFVFALTFFIILPTLLLLVTYHDHLVNHFIFFSSQITGTQHSSTRTNHIFVAYNAKN